MAYRRLGRLVPRDAHEQEAAAEALEEGDLRAGDLVFFGPAERADHVAFWLGRGADPACNGTRWECTRWSRSRSPNARGEHEPRYGRL